MQNAELLTSAKQLYSADPLDRAKRCEPCQKNVPSQNAPALATKPGARNGTEKTNDPAGSLNKSDQDRSSTPNDRRRKAVHQPRKRGLPRATVLIPQAVFQKLQPADGQTAACLAALSVVIAVDTTSAVWVFCTVGDCAPAGRASGPPTVSSIAIANPAARAVRFNFSLLIASPTSLCWNTQLRAPSE